ncbi:hypothetical protein B0T19DRAFT_195958 [Cercophora scortea]|uniref:Uncharacterized protein n=1 Tax=Cercophora scortea TaxID=314031 RepID=A0AAE0MDJ7_9PEZI|nr:hypothetical protein B0T19DRAFT_195958 [Cercophora scortea]
MMQSSRHAKAHTGSGQSHGHGHREKSKSQKPSGKEQKSTPTPTTNSNTNKPRVSFLFVVNELNFSHEPLPGDSSLLTDQWGSEMPPIRSDAYSLETAGTVFRYADGAVSPAPGYVWLPSNGPSQPGCMAFVDDNNMIAGIPKWYKTQSIFACSAHLPIIVAEGDVSLGSWMRRGCTCDAVYDQTAYPRWDMLHFSSADGSGVSRARIGSLGCPYVGGKSPSWIPSLVPRSFKNTRVETQSVGLAGELPIVLALMAFHSAAGRASEIFARRLWWNHRWVGPTNAPVGYPLSGGVPRGFLVNVCLDELDDPTRPPEYYAPMVEAIENLEWYGILVRD